MTCASKLVLTSLLLPAAMSSGCVHPVSIAKHTYGGPGVSLRYEGTCAHLACCSAYAVEVAAGTPGAFSCGGGEHPSCSDNAGWRAPAFTCDPTRKGRYRQPEDPPYLACNDRDLWLSIPGLTHTECGESYVVCHRGARVMAAARDRSASNESGRTHYEASLGLLLAIGADPGERESFASVYPAYDRERIAADPECVASTSALR